MGGTVDKIHQRSVRRRRNQREDTLEKRAIRALSCVNLGELSAGISGTWDACNSASTHRSPEETSEAQTRVEPGN